MKLCNVCQQTKPFSDFYKRGDYEILLRAKQNNACAICQKTFETDADYHVDHCHATKKIRGLLCPGCNRGLGCFQDNPTALRQAANYVECQDSKISDEISTE